jgi:ABC-type multidrug transport system fused ATPase/permease subunit
MLQSNASMQKYFLTISTLWVILRPFHKYFHLQLLLILISQLFIVGLAFVNGSILTAIVKSNWNTVIILFTIYLVANIIDVVLYYFDQQNKIKHLEQPLFQYLQEFSMKKILALPPADHIEDHSALKLSVIAKGEGAVQSMIDKIVSQVIPTITLLTITIVTLTLIHPLLGIISVSVFASVFILSYRFQKAHYPYITKNRDNWNNQQKERTEAFEHLTLIKTLSRENYFIERFMSKRQKTVNHHIFTHLRSAKNNLHRNSLIEFSLVSTLAAAVYLYAHNAFAIGIIYTVFSLVGRVYWNISSFSSLMRELPQSYADVEKYLIVIEREPSFKESGTKITTMTGEIVAKNLSFHYPKNDKNVLNNISFVIPEGKITAFVGESGSGKSTIVKLLLRTYEYTGGSLSVNNEELRNIEVSHLREHIGYVEQHVDLLDDTVRENILFGVNHSLRSEKEKLLESIAEKARIDQFYHRLGEKKFDTFVGERGVKLSGGERQRVGIARAIIKDPDILIFDEATSSLDTENEKYVMDAIKEVSKGKTTIIIAHRLSTVKDADQIIVMDRGRVVGTGTHEELLAANSYYQTLVQHQLSS